MKTETVIGLMSGTSLDGVDIACCEFWESHTKVHFNILAAETIPYPAEWKVKLEKAPSLSGLEITRLDLQYGTYLGKLTNDFIDSNKIRVQWIASHGHTIFHQPDRGFTLQIGHGAAIAAKTGKSIISDFRSLDVALGGQGAPLVPVGDKHLFGEYDFCLNLGGFENISMDIQGKRIAFDICPANTALNHFAEKLGFGFDKNGHLAAQGKLNVDLLEQLNQLDYYSKTPPKSLGREWLETSFLPLINQNIPITDVLSTLCEHIAMQTAKTVSGFPLGNLLITGGGAENGFLISRIREHIKHQIVIPDKTLIHFKEALVFAYLGWLRSKNKINTFSSVTGATRDSSGGIIFYS